MATDGNEIFDGTSASDAPAIEINSNLSGCKTISSTMFGGNYFFANGNANISDDMISWARTEVGITGWRYPGGSIAEQAFDITDQRHFSKTPEDFIDAPSGDTVVPLSKFLKLAAEAGTKVSIVVPTIHGLIGDAVETDRDDDIQCRDVDQSYLQAVNEFVSNALKIAQHWGASISAFEIGNEFWGSGQMNQIEYGKLAGLMTVEVDAALQAADYDADILIQTVHSRNEYNDNIYGHAVQPSQIADGIKAAGAADLVDGIVNHIYADDFAIDEGDKDTAFASYAKMEQALFEGPGARSEGQDRLTYSLTEWNLQAKDADEFGYGLKQATIITEMFFEAAKSGIDSANIWKVMGSSLNSTALVHAPEESLPTDAKIKHGGAVFDMLSESVRRLSPDANGDLVALDDGYDVEYFNYAGEGRNVLFITNQSPYQHSLDLDVSSLLEGFGSSYYVTGAILGDNAAADASSEELAASDVITTTLSRDQLGWQKGVFHVDLDDWEIFRLEVTAITPNAEKLYGREGNDYIVGQGGHDTLFGNGGDDILIGGSGGDTLVGGDGRDRAQYSNAQSGVFVNLANPEDNTGQAAGDTYMSIEDIYGSSFNDVLHANWQDNRLWGGEGNDKLAGRWGDDSLFGMEGADTFVYAAGWGCDTIMDFEAGIDHVHLREFDDSMDMEALADLATVREDNVIFDFGDGEKLIFLDTDLQQALDSISIL